MFKSRIRLQCHNSYQRNWDRNLNIINYSCNVVAFQCLCTDWCWLSFKPKHVADFLISKHIVMFDRQILIFIVLDCCWSKIYWSFLLFCWNTMFRYETAYLYASLEYSGTNSLKAQIFVKDLTWIKWMNRVQHFIPLMHIL